MNSESQPSKIFPLYSNNLMTIAPDSLSESGDGVGVMVKIMESLEKSNKL